MGALHQLWYRQNTNYFDSIYPSNVTLTITSQDVNTISWTINGIPSTIHVERSIDGKAFEEIAILLWDVTSYEDTQKINGVLYYYRIRFKKFYAFGSYYNAIISLSGDTTTGLVANWQINEGSGSTIVDSVSANNGTIIGADWVAGPTDYALNFDGVSGNDAVYFGDILDSVLAGANKKFSFECWIKANALMPNNYILTKYNISDNARAFIYRIITNKLELTWISDPTSGSNYVRNIGQTVLDKLDKWYHIVTTHDGTLTATSRVKHYIDSVEEPISVTVSGSPTNIQDISTNLALGASINNAHTASTNNFNGKIANFKIYNRVLSQADINSLYYANYTNPTILEP